MSDDELCQYLPALVGTMFVVAGRPGLEMARLALRRYSHRLTRAARRECDDMIQAFNQGPIPPAERAEPSQWTVYDICAGDAFFDGEEELPTLPEQRRKPRVPGRNDPCWCGSGKKYKKCHLDKDQDDCENGAPPNEGEYESLRRRLGGFMMTAVPRSEAQRAAVEFSGSEKRSTDEDLIVMDWMMHDWIPHRLGRTVMQEFLRRNGAELSTRDRSLVESWSKSHVGLYEIQDVREGVGIEVKDLLLGDAFFVHDISVSRQAVRYDVLFCRVVEGERGVEMTGAGTSVPRGQVDALREWLEDDRLQTGLPWAEYFKRRWPRIRLLPTELGQAWLDNLKLANTDGEELLCSKSIYRVLTVASLLASLKGCPELAEDEEGRLYSWLRGSPGKEGRTILGTIRIKDDELTLECNSRQRHERARTMIEGLAGPSLRHLRDEHITQKEMKRQVGEERTKPEPRALGLPPDVERDLVSQALARHYAKWPDTKLPALDGRTPRQAAKTAAGRRKLEELLRDFENHEERNRKAGKAYYDIGRIRAELKLK